MGRAKRLRKARLRARREREAARFEEACERAQTAVEAFERSLKALTLKMRLLDEVDRSDASPGVKLLARAALDPLGYAREVWGRSRG